MPTTVLAGEADAGLLRQRDEQLRRATAARRASSNARLPPQPRAHAGGRTIDRRRRAGVLRLRLQDPGEHGPAAPRPHRVRPHLLRQVRARHDRALTPAPARSVRLSSSHKLFGQERETVDEAYRRRRRRPRRPLRTSASATRSPTTRRSSTTRSRASRRSASPTCTTEHRRSSSGSARASTSCSRKASSRSSSCATRAQHVPLLAAVGPLQFEVVQYRLESEYGARVDSSKTPVWEAFRWLRPDTDVKALKLPTGCRVAYDSAGQPGVLFPSAWTTALFRRTKPRRRAPRPTRRSALASAAHAFSDRRRPNPFGGLRSS